MAQSRTVVYSAIAGNVLIAVTKFIVAGISGSSAMLSEAVHSVVDTSNDLLLLVGIKRSEQEPDHVHPFGYGKEVYFWSLMVAILIFGFGGGVSVYEGILHIRNPEPLRDPTWNYIVLAFSFVFEGISFWIGLNVVLKKKGEKSFLNTLHTSKDPSIFTVVAEDSAALTGLVLAALGIYGSHRLNMPVLDGLASIAIGLLLAVVAVLLIYESRELLIGEGIDKKTAAAIRDLVSSDQAVETASMPLSMYLGPEEVLLTLDVEFKSDTALNDISEAVQRIEREIRSRYGRIKRIYIEANATAVSMHSV
jgi:cation diffusion facilitator family transporter